MKLGDNTTLRGHGKGNAQCRLHGSYSMSNKKCHIISYGVSLEVIRGGIIELGDDENIIFVMIKYKGSILNFKLINRYIR